MIDKEYLVEGTKNTPRIYFKPNGECSITGNSFPNDLDDLYKGAKKYLRELIENEIIINFTFHYDYFNTFTQRYNYEILEELNKQKIKGKTVWMYSERDEDSEDMADVYKSAFPDLNIKIKIDGYRGIINYNIQK